MCGIAGIVSAELAASGRLAPTVADMCRRLRHRGPDGSGVHVHGAAALGAERLAIIDPRPIPQPVVSSDGRLVIAYNGEVYNHRELRRELESRGARFVTDTDTEVVLESWRAHGPACVERFVGMFAFVILDRATGHLFGARDRMGQKPFFYHDGPGLFAFASFLPSFAAVPGLSLEPDLRALFDVVEIGYVLGPKTACRAIRQLPPGHALTLEDGRLRTFPYWRLADHFRAGAGDDRGGGSRAGAEALPSLLRDAVRSRLIADVPLGALLSGGIDSSIVTSLMTELSPERVKTFTVAFDVPGFDESRHAALVARELGTDHHVETMRLDDPGQLTGAQWHVGEPLADTSVLPTFLVSKIARRRVKVALSGDGADELFAGYETFRADRALALVRRLPAWPLRPALRALARALPVDFGKVSTAYRLRRFASGLDLAPADAHCHWRALQSHADALACFLPEARAELDGYSPVERFRELDAEVAPCDAVNRASYVDLMTYLPDDILVKVDRASMGHGLEARNPFLDHRLVEQVARLPGSLKLRGLKTKWILRRQQAHRLPRAVVRRRKEGFSAPVGRWLLGSMRERFFELTTPERFSALGLSSEAARRLHADLESRRDFNAYVLWGLLTVGLWDALRGEPESPVAP